jgi:cell wall-associated NlpC family hydrolase
LPSRTVRGPRPLVLGLILALAAVVLAAPAASAAPSDLDALQKKLDKQNDQSDQVVEAYLAKKLQLDTTRRQERGLSARVELARTEHARLQTQVDVMAAGVYMRGPGAQLGAVLDTEPNKALQGIQMIDMMAQRNDDLMSQFRVVSDSLEISSADLAKTEKALEAQLADLTDEKAKVEKAVADTKSLISDLRARQAAARVPVAQRYGSPPKITPVDIHIGGNRGAAVAYAMAQRGKPYSWGAAGPGAFDCSGLVMMAWRAGGRSLPHSSSAMRGMFRVATNPKPGDIVWHPGHVALYIGGGQQVAAPHTGEVVQVQPVRGTILDVGA